MKIIKTASGKKSVKLSKREWLNIGKKAGWIKKAQVEIGTNALIDQLKMMIYYAQQEGNNCQVTIEPLEDHNPAQSHQSRNPALYFYEEDGEKQLIEEFSSGKEAQEFIEMAEDYGIPIEMRYVGVGNRDFNYGDVPEHLRTKTLDQEYAE